MSQKKDITDLRDFQIYVGFTDIITVADGGNRMLSFETPLSLSGSSRDVDLPFVDDSLSDYTFNWTCFNLNKNETCKTIELKPLVIPQERTPTIAAKTLEPYNAYVFTIHSY